MNPHIKSIRPCVFLVMAVMFVVACRVDVSVPYYEDGPLEIQFPNFTADQFISMQSYEDTEKGIQYTKYHSKGEQPNLVIAREYSRSAYDDLQKGRKEVCPPDFMPGLPKEILTVPSHTEVLNDTSFLFGTLWYEFEHGHTQRKKVYGKIGWQGSIISPKAITYIHFWQEAESKSPDSLVLWGLDMRNEVVIGFKEGLGD